MAIVVYECGTGGICGYKLTYTYAWLWIRQMEMQMGEEDRPMGKAMCTSIGTVGAYSFACYRSSVSVVLLSFELFCFALFFRVLLIPILIFHPSPPHLSWKISTWNIWISFTLYIYISFTLYSVYVSQLISTTLQFDFTMSPFDCCVCVCVCVASFFFVVVVMPPHS